MSCADFVKIPWNKYEAALLVDATRRCRDGLMPRAVAITDLSQRLRLPHVQSENGISDTYRNEAGISLQMSAIDYLFSDGASGTSHSNAIFREVFALYSEYPEVFAELLYTAEQQYPLVGKEVSSSFASSESKVEKVIDVQIYAQVPSSSLEERLQHLLIEKFPKGFRLNSHIEISRLQRLYSSRYGEEQPIQVLDDVIRKSGIVHDGRVYLPDAMLPADARELLFRYIEKEFEAGHDSLYYEAVYSRFEALFQEGAIFDAGVLKTYIQYYRPDLVYHKFFMTNSSGSLKSLESTVSQCYLDAGRPLTDAEVCSALYYIPQDTISNAISRVPEIISSGRGQKFHVEIVHIPQTVLCGISQLINNEISSKRFISEKELLDVLKVKYSEYFSEGLLPDVGIRNALAYLFRDKYKFDGKIISSYEHPFDMSEVFRDFSKSKDSFTLSELQSLANDLGTQIYFDAIFESSARINHDVYVKKSELIFQTELTDSLLEKFLDSDYLPIKSISSFGVFPEANYPWNNYLLESYLYSFSSDFKLIHTYFNANFTYGAIVKKSSRISSFDELISLAIADSNCTLAKDDALEYLVDMGYIVKRTYNNIDAVIQNARAIRNHRLSTKG